MPNWIVQFYQDEKPYGDPLDSCSTADAAIRSGNAKLAARPKRNVNVVVYHRLFPGDVALNYPEAIPENEIHGLASDLEKQARQAAEIAAPPK